MTDRPGITFHGRRIIEVLRERYGDAPIVGAEIGVFRGKNAACLLDRLPGLYLYLVDHWGMDGEWKAEPNDMTGRIDTPGRESDILEEARKEVSFAHDRCFFVVHDSLSAVSMVPNDLDFVFIDGDHRYKACLADLRAWWPKLRRGGILFGHDLDNPDPRFSHWGVRRAVEEFFGSELQVMEWPAPDMLYAIDKP